MANREQADLDGKGVWLHDPVEDFQVPDTTISWQTQISTAPDGSKLAGIRKFVTKKTGARVITNQGFSIVADEISPRLLRKLSKMLVVLADHVESLD